MGQLDKVTNVLEAARMVLGEQSGPAEADRLVAEALAECRRLEEAAARIRAQFEAQGYVVHEEGAPADVADLQRRAEVRARARAEADKVLQFVGQLLLRRWATLDAGDPGGDPEFALAVRMGGQLGRRCQAWWRAYCVEYERRAAAGAGPEELERVAEEVRP